MSLAPKDPNRIFPAMHQPYCHRQSRKCLRLQPAAALTFFTSQPEDTNSDSKTSPSQLIPLKKKIYKDNNDIASNGCLERDLMVDLWDRTLLLRRQLTLATDSNDFNLAIRIKSELFATVSKLSRRYTQLYVHIETIMDPTAGLSPKRTALEELSLHGDSSILPIVSSLVYNGSTLKREAEGAAAAIRHRSVSPMVIELCRTGALHLITLLGETNEDNIDKVGAEAVAVYSAALEEDQSCATALAGRGAALYCLRQYEAAAADLKAAVHLDPWNTNASRMLALTHGQLKQFSSAFAALATATILNPSLLEDRQHQTTKRVIQVWADESKEWKQSYLHMREIVEKKTRLERLIAQTQSHDD